MSIGSVAGDRESFEGQVVPNAAFDLTQYEANEDYFFAAYRLFSWFPVVNVWGKTYFPDDVTPDVLDTVVGSEVNLYHDASKMIGTVVAASKTADGLDVLIRIKRTAVDAHNVTIDDIASILNKCSLELRKDPDTSDYLVLNDDLSVDRTIPSMAGMRSGMRPTSANDPMPFYYRGNQRVVERVKPVRFTGVGLLSNPADKTALGYGIVASDDQPENPVAPVPEPAGESENNKDTQMELDELKAALKDANDKLSAYDTEKASASTEIGSLKTQLAELSDKIKSLETEAASATERANGLQAEKDARVKQERTVEIFNQFNAIFEAASDEDKALYQEKAAAACDDNGVIREFGLDLREKKVAALEAAQKPAEPAAEPVVEKPADDKGAKGGDKSANSTEQASDGTAGGPIVPQFDGADPSNNGRSSDDNLLLA